MSTTNFSPSDYRKDFFMGIFSSLKKAGIEARLKSQPNFKVSSILIGEDGKNSIAIDENNKTILLDTPNQVNPRTFSFKDIVSCEILTDGNSTTTTVSPSRLSRGIVGGALLGIPTLGAGLIPGLILGGLSGKSKTTSSETVERIDLRVVVSDLNQPVHEVNLYAGSTKKGSSEYKRLVKPAMEKASHWHNLIEVIIKRVAEEEGAQETTARLPDAAKSTADEISKLLDLKIKGVLTQEEFDMQKRKLLS